MDDKKMWDAVVVEMELSVSEGAFSIWFKNTYFLKREDDVFYLAVPNPFVKSGIQTKFNSNILRSLRNQDPAIRGIEYVITDKKDRNEAVQNKKEIIQTKTTKGLPLNEMIINRDNNLNPKYTFETFVVGAFNEFAYAACQTIIKKPVAYNPLFIYGNTGLGKTHIMQAVGNHIKNTELNKKVYYITSERFAQEMVDALQANRINAFKEKYRKYDVFILDDIQFLSNKEKTQEELFHIFNYLYDNNKQIIFSSDVHPNYIPNLESRLKSRFVSGMIIDIPQPDYESRVEIIKKKALNNNLSIPQDIIEFVAGQIEGNIREIEGALNNILHHIEVKGKPPHIGEIKNLIKVDKRPMKQPSVKDVVKIIAGFYNIEEDHIYNKSRKKEVVKPRQVAMYVLREFYNISFPSIGQKLGGRDHTTVMHSCEKIKEDLKVDGTLLQELDELKQLL